MRLFLEYSLIKENPISGLLDLVKFCETEYVIGVTKHEKHSMIVWRFWTRSISLTSPKMCQKSCITRWDSLFRLSSDNGGAVSNCVKTPSGTSRPRPIFYYIPREADSGVKCRSRVGCSRMCICPVAFWKHWTWPKTTHPTKSYNTLRLQWWITWIPRNMEIPKSGRPIELTRQKDPYRASWNARYANHGIPRSLLTSSTPWI